MRTALRSGQTLLFIGDSITECGRREERHRPLGCGYVAFVRDLLLVHEPAKRIAIVNSGIGGNTVDDLRSRWTDDCLAHRPDWLVVGVGINDLNQHLCGTARTPLSPEAYEEIYDGLIADTCRAVPGCRIVLLAPFYGSTDTRADSYRAKVAALLPSYQAAVARIADRHGARLVDLHAVFQHHLRHLPANVLFPDEPVHPGQTGHALIAHAVHAALRDEIAGGA